MVDEVRVKDFLVLLTHAERAGKAKIIVDFDKVTHLNSPLPFESFKGQIAYIYLGLIAIYVIVSRWAFGVDWTNTFIGLGAVSLFYWAVVRGLLEKLAKRRIIARLLSDGDAWEKIWRFGGITVRVGEADDAAAWAAPTDSWKEAYRHLSS